MLPANQENADNAQSKQAAPAALLKTVRKNIKGILRGGKTQGRHAGVDNSIQNRVKFAAKDQEDAQYGQPLEALFDERGYQGAGCQVSGEIEPVNS